VTSEADFFASDAGPIPVGWEASAVGAEFDVRLGKMLDAARNVGEPKPYLGNRSVQWGQIDVNDPGMVPLTRAEQLALRLRSGDLLVCEGGEVGRAAIWRDELPECYYQKALHRLRPRNGYSPELMAAYLRFWSDRGALADYVTQTSIAHLPREKLVTVPLPRPPAIEQRAITAALSDVDALLTKLDQLIAKKRDLKQAAMQQLLNGRTRLPGHSGQWRSTSIGAFADVIRGVAYRGDSDLYPYAHPSAVVLLRANNVRDASINLDEVQFVDEACVADVQLLRLNDILICMANGSRQLVGKAARLVKSPVERLTFGAFMGCLRVRRAEADVRFVAQLLQALRYRNYVANLLAGSSINNLRPGDVAAMEFDMPPLAEQQAIADALADMDTELAALEARREKTRQIKRGMMQALLTGRIRLV